MPELWFDDHVSVAQLRGINDVLVTITNVKGYQDQSFGYGHNNNWFCCCR